jgi:hypothetical protein
MQDSILRNFIFVPFTEYNQKTRRIKWAGHGKRLKEGRNFLNILTGKPIEMATIESNPKESNGEDNIHIKGKPVKVK